DAVREAYNSNLFINSFLKKGSFFEEQTVGNSPGISTNIINGLNVTTIADGMAKFLIKRAKEELNIVFFTNFKKTIENQPDLQSLFPETRSILMVIDKDIYKYNSYMQALREAFNKDLNQIIEHLPGVIANHTAFFSKNTDLKAILISSCYLVTAFKNGKHPGDIINDYPADSLDTLKQINWKGAIQTLQLFSGAFRDTGHFNSDTSSYWVSPDKIELLLSDETAFKIFMGLNYAKAISFNGDSIRFKNITLCQILDTFATYYSTYYPAYKNYFAKLIQNMDRLSEIIAVNRKAFIDSTAWEQYCNYVNITLDLVETTVNVSCLIPKGFQNDTHKYAFFLHTKDSLGMYLYLARSSINMAFDIKRRNYSSVIVNVVSLWDIAFQNGTGVLKSAVLLKYGTFMAAIVQAKNPDDVQNAIEAAALPAGSAAIKRHSYFDLSLNGYVGAFYGRETDNNSKISKNTFNSTGITAPIGVAISTSYDLQHLRMLPKWEQLLFFWWWPQQAYIFASTTIFVSIVDIGAVTAYRFQNDSISALPDFKWQNILAPGAHIILGISGFPLSIGGGIQLGPQLRSVKDTAATINTLHGYRWAVFGAVDIPLLNFYSKPW
ncbi:MAG TPA: hypothetical protein VHO70_21265, partial [Chitinispirillaceae bacterium]|nr:hypothetical protein [Chitinispirillaceae bacterium]